MAVVGQLFANAPGHILRHLYTDVVPGDINRRLTNPRRRGTSAGQRQLQPPAILRSRTSPSQAHPPKSGSPSLGPLVSGALLNNYRKSTNPRCISTPSPTPFLPPLSTPHTSCIKVTERSPPDEIRNRRSRKRSQSHAGRAHTATRLTSPRAPESARPRAAGARLIGTDREECEGDSIRRSIDTRTADADYGTGGPWFSCGAAPVLSSPDQPAQRIVALPGPPRRPSWRVHGQALQRTCIDQRPVRQRGDSAPRCWARADRDGNALRVGMRSASDNSPSRSCVHQVVSAVVDLRFFEHGSYCAASALTAREWSCRVRRLLRVRPRGRARSR